ACNESVPDPVERFFRLRCAAIGPDCTGRGGPGHCPAPCAEIRCGGSVGGVQRNELSRATPHDPARVNAPPPPIPSPPYPPPLHRPQKYLPLKGGVGGWRNEGP